MFNYWPRLVLTDYEKKYIDKYTEPNRNRRGVLRRFYPGSLVLTAEQRLPTFSQNIARRVRVFGITFSGDIEHFRVRIFDVTGEQYLANDMYIPHLVGGYVQTQVGIFGGLGTNPSPGGLTGVCIFNPNIVLAPNQTLSISGLETEPRGFDDTNENDYRVDFTWHVWEFPGMPGSPS